MSRPRHDADLEDLPPAVCEFCGGVIEAFEQRAVTDGGQPTAPTKFEEWSLLEVEFDCLKANAKRRFMEEFDRREARLRTAQMDRHRDHTGRRLDWRVG